MYARGEEVSWWTVMEGFIDFASAEDENKL